MKKTYLTGIKPTGVPHIGNYFGAILPAIEIMKQNKFKCFYFIADYHALTTIKENKALKELIFEVACIWLGCGIDPKKVVFYKQSDISEIFEITTIINNITPKGLLNRAHAYKAVVDETKEKGLEQDSLVNMGLYMYPVLMTSDIITMNTNFVPIGEDQKQHIEIARDIVKAFNKNYGNVFVMPTEIISKNASLVLGLDGRKMSKSYNNIIPLFESEEKLKKIISQIKTDSTLPNEPKDKNSTVFQYYKLFATPSQIQDFSNKFDTGISWAQAKNELFNIMNNYLSPMRKKYNFYKENPQLVDEILIQGAKKARKVAKQTLLLVKQSLGVK